MASAFLKRTALVLVLALSLCLFSGCELQPEKPQPLETLAPVGESAPGDDVAPEEAFTTIDPDYFELLADNCDVTIHTQESVRVITFMLISAQPLNKYDVTLSSDQGATTYVRLTKANMQTKMPLNVYLCYQDFDWAEYLRLEQTDYWAAADLMDQYEQELNEHHYNRLFSYRVQVFTTNLFSNCKDEHNQWALPQATVEIQDLTVTVKGQSKTYHPKCLRLTSAPLPEEVDCGLSYIRVNPARVTPSPDGKLYSDGLFYDGYAGIISLKKLTIADHPDIVIHPSPINAFFGTIASPLTVWTPGEDHRLLAATEQLELHWTDPAMAGVVDGTGLLYTVFDYERVNSAASENAPGRMIIPLVYNVFGNAYEYYAQVHDGVDVLSYYRDYVAAQRELEIQKLYS